MNGWEVQTRRLPLEDGLEVAVIDPAGERFARRLYASDEDDVRVLRRVAAYWRHGDRAAQLQFPEAALVDHCLAIEQLFPHLSERLPA